LFIGAATVGPFCHEQHLFSAAKLLKNFGDWTWSKWVIFFSSSISHHYENYILSSTKALEPIALRAQHCHRWRIAQTGHARGCFCRSNCVSGSVRRGLSRFNSARHQFPAPLPSALRKLQAWEWYWFSDVVRRCFGRRSIETFRQAFFPKQNHQFTFGVGTLRLAARSRTIHPLLCYCSARTTGDGLPCLWTEGIASWARVIKFRRKKISGQVDRGQRPLSGSMESCVEWTTAHQEAGVRTTYTGADSLR
jgi:hypothetical protein